MADFIELLNGKSYYMGKFTATIVFFLLTLPSSLLAQDQSVDSKNNEQTISIFLDCRGCSESYIRNEVEFVNYVRNTEDADMHLLITRQRTGSGGLEYTLQFLGKKQFQGKNDTLVYISPESDTDDLRRQGLVKFVKIGLLPYFSKTDLLNSVSVYFDKTREVQSSAEEDPWNSWVFELDGFAYFRAEETRNNIFLSGGVNASRVTPDWKIRFDYDQDYNRRSFTDQDSTGKETTEVFITRRRDGDGLVVKSLSRNWSAGISSEAGSSTRNNIDLNVSLSPAIEYNIFPYEEYARHEISFLYRFSGTYFDYDEVTIFNKQSEYLFEHRFRSTLEFTQPWGEIEGRINASAYMHDFNKNRLDFDLEMDVRVYRGLSVSFSGRYSRINDQLFLPKGEVTDAEQLLNLRQQATSFSMRGSVGIEYTFGSIYNNVVNPRF